MGRQEKSLLKRLPTAAEARSLLNHAMREVNLARRFVKLAEVADRLRETEQAQRKRRRRT
jgi:hypothetical protein